MGVLPAQWAAGPAGPKVHHRTRIGHPCRVDRGEPGRITCPRGQMAEWLKAHAWRACIPHKGIEGSNPSLSVNGYRLSAINYLAARPGSGTNTTNGPM